jgi:hypothetical protein
VERAPDEATSGFLILYYDRNHDYDFDWKKFISRVPWHLDDALKKHTDSYVSTADGAQCVQCLHERRDRSENIPELLLYQDIGRKHSATLHPLNLDFCATDFARRR